jgi:hypothetical protein
MPRYEVDKLELEIIGSSNDTNHFKDPALPPLFENFKAEPTITGGGDGALDPELKQPKIDPPAPRFVSGILESPKQAGELTPADPNDREPTYLSTVVSVSHGLSKQTASFFSNPRAWTPSFPMVALI